MRHRRPRSSAAAICAALSVLAFCPAAGAQVVVEPESPAGQEYSLPFERARQQGAGNEDFNASPAAQDPTPVFGEGISRQVGATRPEPGGGAGAKAATANLPGLDDGGGAGTLPIVAVIAGVVLLAALAFATGAAARRAP